MPTRSHKIDGRVHPRFPAQLMHAAARLYYLENATQAEIADRLGTSRPTVSRVLAEARRQGIVRIQVLPPVDADDDALGCRAADALNLTAVHVAPVAHRALIGATLAPKLSAALSAVGLQSGDVLLVSSGRTVWEAAQADLPKLPGVLVTPMVGGQDEPQAWYQTNEITRLVADKVGGRPVFLYAPALPGPQLREWLVEDPGIRRVLELWDRARCAIVGIGAPPMTRQSLPAFVPRDLLALREAVGDVLARFYDREGGPVHFPGDERLIATSFEALRKLPVSIAVAVGQEKVPGIVAAARAGFFNQLVTDSPTAAAVVAAIEEGA